MSDENQPVILAEGDSVWLKSGGPKMVVEAVDGENVLASWKDDEGNEQNGEFPIASLTFMDPAAIAKIEEAHRQWLASMPKLDEQGNVVDNETGEIRYAADTEEAKFAQAYYALPPAERQEFLDRAVAANSLELEKVDDADVPSELVAGVSLDDTDSSESAADSGHAAGQSQEVGTAAVSDSAVETVDAAGVTQPQDSAEEPAEAPAQEPVVAVDPAAPGADETVTVHVVGDEVVDVTREYKGPEDANLDPQVQPEGADAGQGPAGEGSEEAQEVVQPEVTEQEDFSSNTSETNLAEQLQAALAVGSSSLRDELKGILPEDALAAWSDEALLLYKEKGVWVEKTLRGNWVVDIRRTRALGEWPATALQDWLDGGIATPKGVDEDLVWEEVYKRFKVPGNFTHEATKAYVINGIAPELTKSGLLKQDATRALKSILHWTYAELRGALLGEFEHDHSQDDLLVQLRRRLGLNDTYAGDRLLAGLEEASQEANVNDTLLKSALQEYAALMTKYGANLTETAAGAGQRMLNNAIRNVMKRDYIGFHEGWNIILDFVNTNYNALFTPDKARRGWGQTGLTGQQLAIYENLLTLIIATRAPVGRKQNAEMFNFDTILRYVAKEQERTNIVTYYGSLGQ